MKGATALGGGNMFEVFGGDGTKEKKELFDKLLDTWNDVFKMDDFFVNPVYRELSKTIKLPVDEQLLFIENKSFQKCGDIEEAARNAERKITCVQSEKDKIYFVYLNRLWHIVFSESYNNDYSLSAHAREIDRTFYYFRYEKQNKTLEFKYQPYIRNNSKSFPQECGTDILELSFLSGSQPLRASVYWQPEVTSEQTESDPQSFFNKIGRSDVYENLKTFVEKLNAPIEKRERLNRSDNKKKKKRKFGMKWRKKDKSVVLKKRKSGKK